MSQELYTKLLQVVEDAYLDALPMGGEAYPDNFKAEEYLKEIKRILEFEQEISCSVPGCLEKAFTCQCIQHYNELLEKNAELAEDLGEKKCHCSDQNHIMEPIA